MKAVKVTIPETGKVVVLREPRISDQQLASQSVGNQVGDSAFAFALALNKEMVRLLICQIDGVDVSAKDLLSLDNYLSVLEFSRISQVVGDLSGNKSPLAVQTESVNFGDK